MTSLVWFRQDLRLADNPALMAALDLEQPVVPVFVFAPDEEAPWAPGGASRWWLHQSLQRLSEALGAAGSRLILRQGNDSLSELTSLAAEVGATHVFWNRRYEPAVTSRDRRIKTALTAAGLEAASFNGSLLYEPWEVQNKSAKPFQVFTPFWRHCLSLPEPAPPRPMPAALAAPRRWPKSASLADLQLLPQINWTSGMHDAWTPGSDTAHALLDEFLHESFDEYKTIRDRPDLPGTSRMSPYLHFGEIGPREIFHAVRSFGLARGQHTTWPEAHFLTEVGWREFAYHLLYHYPHTPAAPLRESYARFPWKSSPENLRAWQRGQTGYPLVDAGMRQLWRSGWMHNRVRMVAASFLVKHLLLPWTAGAAWFWDTLVDADLASNTMGWQWVAGSGADAAPYFRIFNPTTQATRFDPEGAYVRHWVPELARLPPKWIHEPWAAPAQELRDAGVELGRSYPVRIVDHDQARTEALTALKSLGR